MAATETEAPFVVPVDDEHARMISYARGQKGHTAIKNAQDEIDAGRGIPANDAYFENLKARRSRRRAEPAENA